MEARIYSYLSQLPALTALLARFGSKPAVFLQTVPADTDPQWPAGPQYPRVAFAFDKTGDPERHVSATLTIDIACLNGGTPAETLEPIVREAIDCHYFTNAQDTIAASWRRSDWFNGEGDTEIHGVTLSFDVKKYPQQETAGQDPIALINAFCVLKFPNAKVIGRSELPAVWTPLDASPSIYWMLRNIGPGQPVGTGYVDWFSSTIIGFIAAPTESARKATIKSVTEKLVAARRLIFADGSPLMINQLAINMGADQIQTGQITLTATYGVLKPDPVVSKLQHANMRDQEV